MTPFFPALDDPKYVVLGQLDRIPQNVSFLAADPNTYFPMSELSLRWHSETQHVSIDNFQPESYYEEYLMTATYSQKMQDLQRSQIEKLTRLHSSPFGPQSFVEIGCGDGSFLKYARDKVERVLGIEPSKNFAVEARRNGFEVLNGYVCDNSLLTNEKFDSFASRQVFEHLEDPVSVLTGICKMLNPGAVGLIEVPNGHRALRMQRFFEFFPDHVNYYSVNSLVCLASTVGLNVISCSESFDGDYLELWVRNEPDIQDYFISIAEHRDLACLALSKTVESLTQHGELLAIWGCGAKTLSILSALPSNLYQKISYVIDSDPHKSSLFVPNSNIRVISPKDAMSKQPEAILILALSYRQEIAEIVRSQFKSCKTLLTLDDYSSIRQIKLD